MNVLLFVYYMYLFSEHPAYKQCIATVIHFSSFKMKTLIIIKEDEYHYFYSLSYNKKGKKQSSLVPKTMWPGQGTETRLVNLKLLAPVPSKMVSLCYPDVCV